MIVDSSAIIAILKQEQDAPVFAAALHAASRPRIPAPTLLESAIVAGPPNQEALDELVLVAGIQVIPFDDDHAEAARAAHLAYGKKSGSPAKLNFGDCMVYAVARATGQPLLFKGEDFTHTDIESAL